MKRGKTRKSRQSRRRSTRRMRGGVVAPRPENTLLTKAKRVFSFGKNNTVARRLNNRGPNARLGSVYSASTAKQYLQKEQSSVKEVLGVLNNALVNEIKKYRPDFSVDKIQTTNTVNSIGQKYKFTAEEINSLKSKPIDASEFAIDSQTLQTAISGMKNVLKFYKEQPPKTLLQKFKNKALGMNQQEVNNLSEKLKKEMGVDKDTIDTLLTKLSNKSLTFSEGIALLNTIQTVIVDLQDTIKEQADLMKGGADDLLDKVLNIGGKIAYFGLAVFVGVVVAGAGATVGFIAGAQAGAIAGGVLGFVLGMSFMYGKATAGNLYRAATP